MEYTAKIMKILSGGSYKIKIISDENSIFSNGEEYYTNINIIKKVDEKFQKNLNKKFKKDYENHLEIAYGKNESKYEEYNYSYVDDSYISDSELGIS